MSDDEVVQSLQEILKEVDVLPLCLPEYSIENPPPEHLGRNFADPEDAVAVASGEARGVPRRIRSLRSVGAVSLAPQDNAGEVFVLGLDVMGEVFIEYEPSPGIVDLLSKRKRDAGSSSVASKKPYLTSGEITEGISVPLSETDEEVTVALHGLSWISVPYPSTALVPALAPVVVSTSKSILGMLSGPVLKKRTTSKPPVSSFGQAASSGLVLGDQSCSVPEFAANSAAGQPSADSFILKTEDATPGALALRPPSDPDAGDGALPFLDDRQLEKAIFDTFDPSARLSELSDWKKYLQE